MTPTAPPARDFGALSDNDLLEEMVEAYATAVDVPSQLRRRYKADFDRLYMLVLERMKKEQTSSDILHAALQQIVLDDDREECCQDFQYSGNSDEHPACCGRPTRGFDRAQEVAHAALRAVLPAHVDQLDDPRCAK